MQSRVFVTCEVIGNRSPPEMCSALLNAHEEILEATIGSTCRIIETSGSRIAAPARHQERRANAVAVGVTGTIQ